MQFDENDVAMDGRRPGVGRRFLGNHAIRGTTGANGAIGMVESSLLGRPGGMQIRKQILEVGAIAERVEGLVGPERL